MAKPRFLALLLVTALLALSFSQGFVEGRKVRVMRAVRHNARLLPEEMVATVMDYEYAKPNTNTHGGMTPPQDPPSPPGH
ncbi:hypothetical protein EJB05_42983 [Eragrostis curvula]|uniref:Uncharacterized protein n=1 Tax=Eragrostis curvula TaxID=38414 RepID=A0A5J9TDP2_9POAL|nr:hypothetical protein EJB05_42983 [Eragrostis curvula]